MKQLLTLALACLLFTGCKRDSEKTTDETTETTTTETPALAFATKEYGERSKAGCRGGDCTNVNISIPVASGLPVVSDSINKKIFNVTREIIYFGEKPTNAKSYEEIMASFIKSYEELQKDFAESFPWEAKLKATVDYKSDSIINIKLNSYIFTGGAHGYGSDRSLIFNAQTGKTLTYANIFKDQKAFTAFAEKKFREKFKIPANKSINSTGLMFENDKFVLPQNIFYKENGLLLLYNPYEMASYADGAKELLLPYSEIEQYLQVK